MRTLLITSLIIVSYLRQSRYPHNVILFLSNFLVIRTSDEHSRCFFKKNMLSERCFTRMYILHDSNYKDSRTDRIMIYFKTLITILV